MLELQKRGGYEVLTYLLKSGPGTLSREPLLGGIWPKLAYYTLSDSNANFAAFVSIARDAIRINP